MWYASYLLWSSLTHCGRRRRQQSQQLMISMMMRMLHPHLASPRKPLGARFLSAAAWHLIKNSLPHLFSSQPSPSSESDLNPPPSPSPNLVLVVHGIGPQVKVQHDVAQLCMTTVQEEGEDGGEFKSNVRSLESLTLRALHARSGSSSGISVVFRPVIWRTSFRSRSSCDEQIKLCTLPSLPRYRAFFNAAILDVFYYTSRALHTSMLRDCAHHLNHE
jgi:hypothetical protein